MEHCWHNDGVGICCTSYPPVNQWREVCCFCGQKRTATEHFGPPAEHGPNVPVGGFVGQRAYSNEYTAECPKRQA